MSEANLVTDSPEGQPNDYHSHRLLVDGDGNGLTSWAYDGAGPNHRHKVSRWIVQTADGHKHPTKYLTSKPSSHSQTALQNKVKARPVDLT